MHIVNSEDTGEDCPKRKPGEKPTGEKEKKRYLPWGPMSYMQEMIAIRGGQGSTPLPESWVTIHVEGKPVGFMVDTGAKYSVITPH